VKIGAHASQRSIFVFSTSDARDEMIPGCNIKRFSWWGILAVTKKVETGPGYGQTKLGRPTTGALEVGGFSIEGVSVGGQETCVMLPALKVAFDIGRCPKRAVDQDFLFITHAHMDHIVRAFFFSSSECDIICELNC